MLPRRGLEHAVQAVLGRSIAPEGRPDDTASRPGEGERALDVGGERTGGGGIVVRAEADHERAGLLPHPGEHGQAVERRAADEVVAPDPPAVEGLREVRLDADVERVPDEDDRAGLLRRLVGAEP